MSEARQIDAPMPIRTTRLVIRPRQPGDGAAVVSAVAETWSDLHQWMPWAESLDDFTEDQQEVRIRHQSASFLRREEFHLIGIEPASGHPVVWCGLHDIDWNAGQCNTGFWVRKSAQGRGLATEATNAMLRYAFGALGMRRVGISHSSGNEASRRIIQKLGFFEDGVRKGANHLPGNPVADRCCYARLDRMGLPS